MNGFLAFIFDLIAVILRVAIPILTVIILVQIYSSLRHNRRDERPLIVLSDESDGRIIPVLYWENSIGRSRFSDIRLNDPAVSRDHAVLLRRDDGWSIADIESRSGVFVNGEQIDGRTNVYLNDEITLGSTTLKIRRAEEFTGRTRRSWFFSADGKNGIPQRVLVVMITIFLLVVSCETCLTAEALTSGIIDLNPLMWGGLTIAVMWTTYLVTSLVFKRVNFEIEALAFMMTGIGIMISVHQSTRQTLVQLISAAAGVVLFEILIKYLENPDRVTRYCMWVYVASLGLLAINLLFGKTTYGAAN